MEEVEEEAERRGERVAITAFMLVIVTMRLRAASRRRQRLTPATVMQTCRFLQLIQVEWIRKLWLELILLF